MHINLRCIAQKVKSRISGGISREIRGLDIKERTYMRGNLKVEGHAWYIRKPQGLFSKTVLVDRYGWDWLGVTGWSRLLDLDRAVGAVVDRRWTWSVGFTVHRLQKGQGVRDLSCSSRIGRLWMRARDQAAADASGPSTDDPTARVIRTRGTAAGTLEGGSARRLARRSWPNLSSRARFGARIGSTRRGGEAN
jgi:hypothetical protein